MKNLLKEKLALKITSIGIILGLSILYFNYDRLNVEGYKNWKKEHRETYVHIRSGYDSWDGRLKYSGYKEEVDNYKLNSVQEFEDYVTKYPNQGYFIIDKFEVYLDQKN